MTDLIWVLVGLIAVSLLLYIVATVVFGPGEPQMAEDVLARALPDDRPLTGDDIRAADLPVALRGYRMAEVDRLLRRAAAELDQAQQAGYQPGATAPEHVPGPVEGIDAHPEAATPAVAGNQGGTPDHPAPADDLTSRPPSTSWPADQGPVSDR